MKSMQAWFSRFHVQYRVVALSLMLVMLIGGLGYLSNTRLDVSVLYLLPVALATLKCDFWAGVLVAIWANVVGLGVTLGVGEATPLAYYKAFLYLGVELLVAYGLTYLRTTQAMREELIQFVAHDFRTPLGNILIGLDILHEQPAVQQDPSLRRLVEMSQTSAQRLVHLSNSMLDLAKLESGQLKVEPQVLAVADVLHSITEQMGLWAEQSHITLVMEPVNAPVYVLADAFLLNRILLNLVGNAIKYSRPETAVTVRVQALADKVRFEVRDQGVGIPPHLVARVFDRFYQVEARRSGQATGSGLGLTFCRAAVLAQKGDIHVESEVGRGTTVVFSLPAAPQQSGGGA